MDGYFDSIFLESEQEDNSAAASNMVSNVSIAYNAGDSTQRNAVLVAQQKIAKAQKRKELKGIKTEFTSIFL